MKKSTRIVKRYIALILLFLFSIESFAAVVGDNDGAAFITKAEFDSLKNDFQSQLDTYNSSIDNKIDGAIAAYLAGVRVETKNNKSILIKNWKTGVQALNGVRLNSWNYPDVSGNFSCFEWRMIYVSSSDPENPGYYVGVNRTGTGTQGTLTKYTNGKLLWMFAVFSYKNAKTTNYRNLVDNVGIGTSLDTSKMVWAGVANNLTESWTLSKSASWRKLSDTGEDHDPGYLENQYRPKFTLSVMLNINKPGYVSSFVDSTNPLWMPTIKWISYRANGSVVGWSDWGDGNCLSTSAIPQISYDKDPTGNAFSYQHIINYKADSTWEVAAKNVTNYILDSTNNTLGTAGWVSEVKTNGTTDGNWSGFESDPLSNYDSKRGTSNFRGCLVDMGVEFSDNTSTTQDGATNDASIPVIGLIGNYDADEIYQYKKGDLVDEDGNDLIPLTLQQGVPLMQVKEEEKIEWEPSFKDIIVDGVTGVNECRLILAYQPFTDIGNLADNNDYVKMDGITKGEWAETTSGKVKIRFEADRNGIVYAKWVPKTDWTTVENNYWEATLDVDNCNTYVSIKS